MIAVRRFASLDSTNAEARRLAERGERGPVWIVADAQTAGRGRRGKAWVSRPGNLFATLLIAAPAPLEVCAQLSFAAALAVADVVASFAPNAALGLKWPNDVLLDGRKVAGILLESGPAPGPDSPAWLALGIGINLADHPEGTDFPAISLAVLGGRVPAPDAALARLGKHWDTWYEAWRAQGFAALREAWLARAAGLGRKIGTRLADRDMEGVFETLDEDGALVLRHANGARSRIMAGEVFFPA